MDRLTYTVAETAAALGISRGAAYDLCHRADFPSIRVGGRWIIPKRELFDWLTKQAEDQTGGDTD